MQKWMLPYLFCVTLSGHAQTIQLETDLGRHPIGNLQSATMGDSAFITLTAPDGNGSGTVNRSYWIFPTGEHREIDLPELAGKSLLNVSRTGDSTYYYFVEEYKKGVVIGALSVSGSGEKRKSRQVLVLERRVYGSYSENGYFYLLAGAKEPTGIRLLRLRGLSIVSEKKYTLPFELAKSKSNTIAFYEASQGLPPDRALASIKITKEKDAVFICRDEPMDEYAKEGAIFQYKTTVFKLNLTSGLATNNIFVEKAPDHRFYNSAVFDGFFYRLIPNDVFRIDVFNLTTRQNVFSHSLKTGHYSEFMKSIPYSRSGEKLGVKRFDGAGTLTLNERCFVSVSKMGNDSVMVRMGVNPDPSRLSVINPVGIGIVGAIVASAVATGVSNSLEDKQVYNYIYLHGRSPAGLSFVRGATQFRDQQIDEYEAQRGEVFSFKGYVNTPNFSYAVYRFKNLPVVQIVKFE
jgi:hypothetical protein